MFLTIRSMAASCPVRTDGQTDRQTDRHDEVKSRCSQVCKRA